jgi:uncharacterized protein (DUF952 family)
VTALIYKILRPAEWAAFETAGSFDGSDLDRADGFVHLSSRAQVAATARRFFADDTDLVIVAIDAGAVAASLRWEGDPDPFPHVYGPLPGSSVAFAVRVTGADAVEAALP